MEHDARRTAANRSARVLGGWLAGLSACGVLGIVAAWPLTGLATTDGAWLGRPYPRMVLLLAAFVAIATLGGGPWRPAWRLAASLCLGAVWASYRVLTMGDGHWWRAATREGTVGYSEPLSSLVHALVCSTLDPAAIEWISPAAGVAATWAWLFATDRLFAGGDASRRRAARCASALVWTSSGVLTVFFHRYVEHTQLGIAPMVLGLAAIAAWSRRAAAGGATARGLAAGSALLALAAATHLVYAAVLCAALGATAVAALPLGPRRLAGAAAVAVAATAGVVAATLGLFAVAPVQFVTGSIAGGADGRWLVPFVDVHGALFGAGTLLASDHLALVAHVVAFGAPLSLPCALALPWLWRRRAQPAAALAPLAAACAWLAFAALYGFDLGWPNDADLMLALSPAAALTVAQVAVPRFVAAGPRSRAALAATGLAATAATWCIVAPLVRPLGAAISARNSAGAALHVDGFADGDGQGPFRVPVDAGQTLTLRAAGPPGVAFVVGRGVPHPACEGHPYGGVLDIEVSNAIQPDELVFGGVFDARGQATTTWRVAPLPDGRMPGVQMLVFAPATGTTSAAFYFERR